MGGWWPFGGKKEAPDMKAASRVQCYDNRDAYFFCLEENGEDCAKCKPLEKKFHDACLPAWVKYFEVQRQRNKALGRPWASPNMEGKNANPSPQRV